MSQVRKKALFAIEIGGTKLQIVAANETIEIVEHRRFTIEPAHGAGGIRKQIATGVEDLLMRFEPLGAGIGFGGPLDRRTGRIYCSHQIEGWADFELRQWAEKLFGAPVAVENDANTAALGEAFRGAGVGRNPVFYVTIGSGIGGGLVVDGSIYHGATPGEAEIGHVRLDREGATVESRCSGWAIDRRIREVCAKNPHGTLAQLVGRAKSGEAKFLGPALEKNDPIARRVLNEMTEDLAFGLSHVSHLCHPEIIVLGGGLSQLGEPLRAAVASQLSRFVMDAFQPGPEVRLSTLGEDAVPVGALLLASRIVKS